MSYIGVNNDLRFIETKPISSYPKSVLKEIKLLSFSKNKLATPFGSYIYRLQKYPGDVDLIEEFKECCSLKEVINKFEKSLKKIVKNILKKKIHYLSEVKIGLDMRYDIDIGKMENGIYHINPNLNSISNKLFKKSLISRSENEIIQTIYNESKIKQLGSDEYDTIKYIFRERMILRWTANEILQGKKILQCNKIITLKEALKSKSPVKIDLLTELNGKLVEITNFLQLSYIDKNGDENIININLRVTNDIATSLPIEIEKLYFSNMYYSPFKMIKRMYSLARHNGDQDLLDRIVPFVSSNTSLLYQIRSEIDTIILILERSKNYPLKTIRKTLDENKNRISTILELDQDDVETINKMIDSINSTRIILNKIKKLKLLKEYITIFINYHTISYMNTVGLNPPPYKYLPPKPTYNYNITRKPSDNPKNPFKKYSKQNIKGGESVYYPVNHTFPNFFDPPNSQEILANIIMKNPGLNKVPYHDIKIRNEIDETRKEIKELENNYKYPLNHFNLESGGNYNGYAYVHNFKIPLYVNENLPIPELLQNKMHLYPRTGSSYASDYHWRGYGPKLKGVNINNAPLVINGQIQTFHKAGCQNCS